MRQRLFWLIPLLLVALLGLASFASGGWDTGGKQSAYQQALQRILLACEADMRRHHPQERPFQLSVGQYDTVSGEVSGKQVSWTLSGTLTRSDDSNEYVFDCVAQQRGGTLRIISHASLWWTPPPS